MSASPTNRQHVSHTKLCVILFWWHFLSNCYVVRNAAWQLSVNGTGSARMNVTLRYVRVTVVAIQKQELLHILSMCLYSELSSMQNACALYFSALLKSILMLSSHYSRSIKRLCPCRFSQLKFYIQFVYLQCVLSDQSNSSHLIWSP